MSKIGANYSLKENTLRVLWSVFSVSFRYSPRLLYGWRNLILRAFGGEIGNGVKIYPSAKIMFPWNLKIGEGSIISWGVILYNLGKITIGSQTVISQYSHICAGTHDYTSKEFKLLKTPIIIGSNVWVAANAFIGPGVTLGNSVVVAACSVVIKDVSPNYIVAGHPAKKIKERT